MEICVIVSKGISITVDWSWNYHFQATCWNCNQTHFFNQIIPEEIIQLFVHTACQTRYFLYFFTLPKLTYTSADPVKQYFWTPLTLQ